MPENAATNQLNVDAASALSLEKGIRLSSRPPDSRQRFRKRLDSWKEIATYVRRDVKTARRWEQREGLPVHRHHHGMLGSVYAFADEIDIWYTKRNSPAASRQQASRPLAPLIVGRTRELQLMREAFMRSIGAQRQVIFVSGELGVGKSTLLDAFLAELPERIWAAAGYCVHQFGAREACLPFADILVQLASDPRVRSVIAVEAPSWTARLLRRPSTHPPHHTPAESPTTRELAEAIEMLGMLQPTVLVLEDLQWADHLTVELLARLAKSKRSTSLMVVGTFRRAELVESSSPLWRSHQELCAHFQCMEMPLPLLDVAAVAAYLSVHGCWVDIPAAAEWFHRRSDGHPLFLAHLLRQAFENGTVVRQGETFVFDPAKAADATLVPPGLYTLIDAQLATLEDSARLILAAASVAGDRFCAASISAGVMLSLSDVERILQRLARRGDFITRCEPVSAPDGSVSGGYAFVHRLHRGALHQGIAPGTRALLEQRMSCGLRLELQRP